VLKGPKPHHRTPEERFFPVFMCPDSELDAVSRTSSPGCLSRVSSSPASPRAATWSLERLVLARADPQAETFFAHVAIVAR